MRSTRQTSAFAETFAGTFDIPLSYVERLQQAAAAAHPMLEAARPLLQALHSVPSELAARAVPPYRQWLLSEARMFERVCNGLKVPTNDASHARYCLCTALDEAAMQTPWGKGNATGTEWTANGVAASLGYDRQGGDRVFALIDSTMRDPHANVDLLMVLQQIVESGFKGRYRRAQDGARTLKSIRKSLDRLIDAMRSAPAALNAAATHARTHEAPAPASSTARAGAAASRAGASRIETIDVPFTVGTAATAASRGTLRRALQTRWLLAATLTTALMIASGIFLYRLYGGWTARPQSPAVAAIAQAIRTRLPEAIASKAVSVHENDNLSRLAIHVDGMFAPGKYALNRATVPMLVQIGQAISTTQANVLVHLTGYTDDTPFENAGGLSNRSLSALRAQSVMQVLASTGVSSERITVNGNGDASPLDDNQTREGRARNRRVEISVEQWH
jgi:type VI secretion system protein ImpK